jgi:hypothetical protein
LTHNDAVESGCAGRRTASGCISRCRRRQGRWRGSIATCRDGFIAWTRNRQDRAAGRGIRRVVRLLHAAARWTRTGAGPEGHRASALPCRGREGDQAAGVGRQLCRPRVGAQCGAILVRHSAINQPTQVYLAADPLHPDKLTALTSFNPIFAERAQPEWQPYTWKADDGRTIEGVLIFPPGRRTRSICAC